MASRGDVESGTEVREGGKKTVNSGGGGPPLATMPFLLKMATHSRAHAAILSASQSHPMTFVLSRRALPFAGMLVSSGSLPYSWDPLHCSRKGIQELQLCRQHQQEERQRRACGES